MITITLTDKQAKQIAVSCEIVARLGIGQFREALECLPTKEFCPPGWHEDMEKIGSILKHYTLDNVDGWNASLGIHSEKLHPRTKINWEIYQTIRHKLAWDLAKLHGLSDGTTRDWSTMNSVNFDVPVKLTDEGLPVILNLNDLVAGAIFDLMGKLTGMEEPVTFGASHDALVAIGIIKDFAKKRGLDISDPDVEYWQDKIQ
jgi:hypothetical protein